MNSFGFLSVIGFLLLVGVVLYVVYVGSQRAQGRTMKFSLTILGGLVAGGVILSTLGRGLIFVNAQERGIVINLFTGVRAQTLQPGIHFMTPFVESARTFSIGQRAYTMSSVPTEGQIGGNDAVTARTSDGQEVFIDATVQYQIDSTNIVDLFIRWIGPNGEERFEDGLVRPQSRSIVYNRVAQYKVEEVYSTKREVMQQQITDDLRKALSDNGLTLTAFLLRNITFNKDYSASVEQKQIAQQQAERAKFIVDQERQDAERVRVKAQGEADAVVTRAKGDAESRIIAAKAEAEALRQVATVIKENPAMLTYRYIEKLSPSIQTILLPSGQNFILDPKSLMGPLQPTSPQTQIAPSNTITP